MADLSINVALVAASNQAIVERNFPFGTAVTQGQLVYLDAGNRWQPVDQNAAATGNGLNDRRGVALNAGANGQPADVATRDPDFTPGATLTNGVTYYGSPNAGAITADVPGAGNYPVFVGLAKSTTKLNLLPVAGGTAV